MTPFLFQQQKYDCGVIAVLNSCRVLGVEISNDELRNMMSPVSYGISERAILRSLRKLGLRCLEYSTYNPDYAWRWVLKYTGCYPIIVCLDRNTHWSVLSGRMLNRVFMIDSWPKTYYNENGVHLLSKDELLKRWKFRVCYGIRVSKP